LIEVAETIDTSVFPLATKKNMQTRAAKVCVFLNEDASKHLNLVEDDDKKKSKDTISTIEDAQTLLLSAQTSLLNDGKVDYAEKCALRVLGEDGDAKDERFEKTRTLRTFASAAFVLALATKNVDTGIERIEKRLKVSLDKDHNGLLRSVTYAISGHDKKGLPVTGSTVQSANKRVMTLNIPGTPPLKMTYRK
jgi:hypothetical protein